MCGFFRFAQSGQWNIAQRPLQYLGVAATRVVQEAWIVKEHGAYAVNGDTVRCGTLCRGAQEHDGTGPGGVIGVGPCVGFDGSCAAADQHLAALALLDQSGYQGIQGVKSREHVAFKRGLHIFARCGEHIAHNVGPGADERGVKTAKSAVGAGDQAGYRIGPDQILAVFYFTHDFHLCTQIAQFPCQFIRGAAEYQIVIALRQFFCQIGAQVFHGIGDNGYAFGHIYLLLLRRSAL